MAGNELLEASLEVCSGSTVERVLLVTCPDLCDSWHAEDKLELARTQVCFRCLVAIGEAYIADLTRNIDRKERQ